MNGCLMHINTQYDLEQDNNLVVSDGCLTQWTTQSALIQQPQLYILLMDSLQIRSLSLTIK